MTGPTGSLSRRRLIAGGAVLGGAAALSGCAPDPPMARPGQVLAVRTRRIPIDDPDAEAWGRSPKIEVPMGPQNIALPHREIPAVDTINVRALYDDDTIGFRLEWDDADDEIDDLTIRVDDFRDACAVLLAPGDADEAMRTMGNATAAATLLHWKADWQRDIESGTSTLATVYPNRSVDVYPPLIDLPPGDVTVDDYADAGATEWLPAHHVGNPLSATGRTTAVEKIIANGFSTSTHAATQNARGRGTRDGTRVRAVLTKPLEATDDGEVALRAGSTATCAFAVWSGADGDAGGRKTPSANVYRLVFHTAETTGWPG